MVVAIIADPDRAACCRRSSRRASRPARAVHQQPAAARHRAGQLQPRPTRCSRRAWSTTSGPIVNMPLGYHYSWIVQILPFIGQTNIYRRFDFRRAFTRPSNDTAAVVRIQTLLCPSDPGPGPGSYAGCHHDVEAPIDADNHGVLYLNSRVVTTISPMGRPTRSCSARSGRRAELGWASGTRSSLRNTGASDQRTRFAPALFSQQPARTAVTVPRRNLRCCEDAGGRWGLASRFVGGFCSWHPGGTNFLFCDGSVRFLKASIDEHIFRFLGNRADGDSISDDTY